MGSEILVAGITVRGISFFLLFNYSSAHPTSGLWAHHNNWLVFVFNSLSLQLPCDYVEPKLGGSGPQSFSLSLRKLYT